MSISSQTNARIGRRAALSLAGSLAGAAAAELGGEALAKSSATAGDDRWRTDPAQVLRNYMRISGDLSGKVAPFRWHGAYVAVLPDANPRVLFACESCETRKIIVRGPDSYEQWSKVMTVFKDPDTGAILNGTEWKNPFTGQMNKIEPNIIGSKTLFTVGSADTVIGRRLDTDASETITLKWTAIGDKVQLAAQRPYPEKRPIPLAELGTTTVDLAALRDSKPLRIEAVFAAVFLSPWQRFMAMPQQPGHSIWHAVGRKMKGFDELTPEYLEQARIYIPDVLAWAKS